MNHDILMSGEELQELIDHVDRIINAKVTYNKDKQVMADEFIDQIILHARLFKSKLLRLRGGCNE